MYRLTYGAGRGGQCAFGITEFLFHGGQGAGERGLGDASGTMRPVPIRDTIGNDRRRYRFMKVRDITKRIRSDGWYHVKSRGDHHQFRHPTKRGKVTVKGHPGDEISGALLASIWRQAELPKPEE